MAKAPVWLSFKISSFRSRLWWLERASQVSQNPSRWIPPERAMGSARASAAFSAVRPRRSARRSQPYSTAPITTPTRGKAHSAQLRERLSHSTRGMGILEYMAKAIRMDFIAPPPFDGR